MRVFADWKGERGKSLDDYLDELLSDAERMDKSMAALWARMDADEARAAARRTGKG